MKSVEDHRPYMRLHVLDYVLKPYLAINNLMNDTMHGATFYVRSMSGLLIVITFGNSSHFISPFRFP